MLTAYWSICTPAYHNVIIPNYAWRCFAPCCPWLQTSARSLCSLEQSFGTTTTLFTSFWVCVVCFPTIDVMLSLFIFNSNNYEHLSLVVMIWEDWHGCSSWSQLLTETGRNWQMWKRLATCFAVLAESQASQASLRSAKSLPTLPPCWSGCSFPWKNVFLCLKWQRCQINPRSHCQRKKTEEWGQACKQIHTVQSPRPGQSE